MIRSQRRVEIPLIASLDVQVLVILVLVGDMENGDGFVFGLHRCLILIRHRAKPDWTGTAHDNGMRHVT